MMIEDEERDILLLKELHGKIDPTQFQNFLEMPS